MNKRIIGGYKNSKYKNQKVLVNGIRFASKKEANRYIELKWLEKTNKIKELELQKKFELQPSYKIENHTIRPICYYADFYYYDILKGKYIVEDTKGYRTEVYKLKKKLFEYKYDMTITEL